MEKRLKKLKRYLRESKEDFLYLFFTGAPIGVIHVLLSRWFAFGDLL